MSKSEGQTVIQTDGHTDRRSDTLKRSDGLRLSKTAYDDLSPSDTV